MSLPTVLVLGGTGPAGICLLRELLHRKHKVVAYARTPSKVPEDLAADPLLQIVKGELSDNQALATAVAGWIGEKGHTYSQKRAALSRWLVNAVEGGLQDLVRKMPAVSKLSGS